MVTSIIESVLDNAVEDVRAYAAEISGGGVAGGDDPLGIENLIINIVSVVITAIFLNILSSFLRVATGPGAGGGGGMGMGGESEDTEGEDTEGEEEDAENDASEEIYNSIMEYAEERINEAFGEYQDEVIATYEGYPEEYTEAIFNERDEDFWDMAQEAMDECEQIAEDAASNSSSAIDMFV